MKPLPLTAIILAHKPGKKLENALASVSFANEVIIIDNNSGVDWTSLSKTYPLTVIANNSPITDFSAVRNSAISEASNDWVLFLDSDEEVVAPAVPKIAVLLTSNAKGGVVTRSDVFHGKKLEYGEAGNQQIIRLGKKGSIQFSGAVHEVASITGELSYTGIEILHHSHDSIKEFIADVSHYAFIAAQQKSTSFNQNLLEMLTYPIGKLLYGLFIQGGIIDGLPGVTYAYCMSLHSLLVRMFRYEILAHSSTVKK
jgi:hypothetical protein